MKRSAVDPEGSNRIRHLSLIESIRIYIYQASQPYYPVYGMERKVPQDIRKSIYGLKQASRQWYLKFHEVRMTFGFKENSVDQCIYLKVSGSKFLFLVLYVC